MAVMSSVERLTGHFGTAQEFMRDDPRIAEGLEIPVLPDMVTAESFDLLDNEPKSAQTILLAADEGGNFLASAVTGLPGTECAANFQRVNRVWDGERSFIDVVRNPDGSARLWRSVEYADDDSCDITLVDRYGDPSHYQINRWIDPNSRDAFVLVTEGPKEIAQSGLLVIKDEDDRIISESATEVSKGEPAEEPADKFAKTYKYDSHGNLLKIVEPGDGTDGRDKVTAFDRFINNSGRTIVRATTMLGEVMIREEEREYDGQGLLRQIVRRCILPQKESGRQVINLKYAQLLEV